MTGDDFDGFTAAELAAVGLEIRACSPAGSSSGQPQLWLNRTADSEDGWNEYLVDGVQAIVPSAPLCEVWDWMPYEDEGKFGERLMRLGLNHPERAERVFGPGWKFKRLEWAGRDILVWRGAADAILELDPLADDPRCVAMRESLWTRSDGIAFPLTPEAIAAITRAPEILRAWRATEARKEGRDA